MKRGTKPLHATFAVAAWCVVYALEHGGNCPSLREIAEHFGVYCSTAQRSVDLMLKHGIAERIDGKLVIVGGQYVPPQWYIDNVSPTLSKTNRLEQSRRNNRMIPVSADG